MSQDSFLRKYKSMQLIRVCLLLDSYLQTCKNNAIGKCMFCHNVLIYTHVKSQCNW